MGDGSSRLHQGSRLLRKETIRDSDCRRTVWNGEEEDQKSSEDESLSEEEKSDLAKLLKTKKRVIKTPIELKTWHQITIVNLGPKFEVYLNQKSLGSFTSEGLDHKVKQIMALGVSGKVIIDDVQIWSLD